MSPWGHLAPSLPHPSGSSGPELTVDLIVFVLPVLDGRHIQRGSVREDEAIGCLQSAKEQGKGMKDGGPWQRCPILSPCPFCLFIHHPCPRPGLSYQHFPRGFLKQPPHWSPASALGLLPGWLADGSQEHLCQTLSFRGPGWLMAPRNIYFRPCPSEVLRDPQNHPPAPTPLRSKAKSLRGPRGPARTA